VGNAKIIKKVVQLLSSNRRAEVREVVRPGGVSRARGTAGATAFAGGWTCLAQLLSMTSQSEEQGTGPGDLPAGRECWLRPLTASQYSPLLSNKRLNHLLRESKLKILEPGHRRHHLHRVQQGGRRIYARGNKPVGRGP